ncbi:TIGR03086 family metal-binding protein [Streptomyces guryensis]|uniref:TIGR03086 family metal-binding protein n=1 Tax=Streptomyces guryensis TaxID=2886947 RepID=A0A9Q3VRP4_9ACTN|nr:TIGR03086 family metal-binding protein [Streptomyces guryensis]MCD9876409.1 TIGR03086 family metal-binding protein [Streptomyces guryensis]
MNATQHSTLHPAIRECAEAVAVTASGIRDEQLQDRTPCEKFTVAQLVDHLGGTLLSAARAARKEAQPGEDATALAMTPQELSDAVGRAAAAWADPASYEGTTEFGPGEMPASLAASITLNELALHGWDLARATGRAFDLGPDTARTALGVVEELAGQARANGSYGPPVPLPSDAPAFERALAVSGRNPRWNG